MELASDQLSAELKESSARVQQLSTNAPSANHDRPETWLFIKYELQPDPNRGGFLLFEHRQVYDRKQDAYKPVKPQPTTVNLPAGLGEAMFDDASLREQVLTFGAELRRQLGRRGNEGGVCLLFDVVRDEAQKIRALKPKWKYQAPTGRPPAAHVRVEQVRLTATPWAVGGKLPPEPDEVPSDVALLVLTAKQTHGDLPAKAAPAAAQYWNHPLYRDWYVRVLQRKREDIIGREIARHDFGVIGRLSPDALAASLTPKAYTVIELMTAAHRELRPEAAADELAETVAQAILPKLLERQRRHGDLLEPRQAPSASLVALVPSAVDGILRGEIIKLQEPQALDLAVCRLVNLSLGIAGEPDPTACAQLTAAVVAVVRTGQGREVIDWQEPHGRLLLRDPEAFRRDLRRRYASLSQPS